MHTDDAGGWMNNCVMACMGESGEFKRIEVMVYDGLHGKRRERGLILK